MPVQAYVLIQVEPSSARRVLSELNAVKGVKEAHVVTGEYDVIARIELEGISGVLGVVVDQIHSVSGIKHTSTHIVIEGPEPARTTPKG